MITKKITWKKRLALVAITCSSAVFAQDRGDSSRTTDRGAVADSTGAAARPSGRKRADRSPGS